MKPPKLLSAWWAARPERERRILLLGIAVVLPVLLWGTWLRPAWQQSQRMPDQMANAEAQWQTVAQLAQKAKDLQAVATVNTLSRSNALAVARSLTAQALGTATPSWQDAGNLLTIRLGNGQAGQVDGLTPTQLAQWLQAMRLQAQLQPLQVRLQRQPGSGRWKGDITFSGPPLQAP